MASAVSRIDLARLDQHVIGALRACRITQASNILHLAGVHEVLEHVSLIHEQLVDADLLQVQQVIHGLVAERLQSVVQALQRGLHLLDLAARTLAVAFLLLQSVDRVLDLLLFCVDERLLKLRRRLDEAKRAVGDDDRVPVIGCDLGQESAAIGALEVLLGCGENVGARVQLVEVSCPLLHQVIGHRDHVLVDQARALQLHRQCDRAEGLAGSDHMVSQHGTGLKPSGHKVSLVLAQRNDAIRYLARIGQP